MYDDASILARPESSCVECDTVRGCLYVAILGVWYMSFVVCDPMIRIRDQS